MTDKFLKVTCEFIRDNINTFTYSVSRHELGELEQNITDNMSLEDFCSACKSPNNLKFIKIFDIIYM